MVSNGKTNGNERSITGRELRPVEGLQIRVLDDPRLVERIRVLDGYCLPIKYGDHYYDTYVRPCAHRYSQIALFHDMLVGSCTCRLERTEDEDEFFLYIMTIAVLEPYRRLGVGSRLLESVLRAVASETKVRVRQVTLHMQVSSPVIEFYKTFGFEVMERVPDYYTNLDECDAYLLRKVIDQPHLESKQHQNRKAKGGAGKGGKAK
ncbi:N-acetyltransferase, putative [Trypanosoma equiperdum]|uniref:N-acetyltransferase, putative n=4 Tax=Trypanozoon TaxID=39700 RepID=Q38BT1_TRYB2|nr:N-acetyltransferase, putative [Trypanosoma brucei gambiense DAL972]XP_822567.1 N-acetyltransferase, putative [Trypanosoma brucei brucei TREU927]RHW68847.1 N-acetyltransferase [Trypanosoma brucei equiperdum]SCU72387.1 N-acetyltransferase, putative [Trypanosoma equiperdum]EAN77739.1 N-acetyltransferase, putative [Trypanosoma brucei brucei TREU927]CBH15313.1 N-acetyltransferase, putative [Trypanosoma brucei gambiense DAL972]|eukprot:XP_011777578.1 N-acetyltransferase, putative [Trypanosoma brucei gambiense DAL972]